MKKVNDWINNKKIELLNFKNKVQEVNKENNSDHLNHFCDIADYKISILEEFQTEFKLKKL